MPTQTTPEATEGSLICVEGPLEGLVLPLGETVILFGRSPGNSVVIPSAEVSRHHCQLRLTNGVWMLQDLNSANGTYVNGRRILQQQLEPGDYLGVGPCRFLLLTASEAEPDQTHVRLVETQIANAEMVRQYQDESLLEKPDKALEAGLEASQAAAALRSLLRITVALNASADPVAIGNKLLESAAHLTGCKSGAVLIPDEIGSGFHTVAVLGEDGRKTLDVPDALIRRVLSSGIAVATASGCLAAPLATYQQILGVLFLAPVLEREAGEEQLRLAAALGAIAGVALRNARNFVSLARENRRLQEAFAIDHDLIGDGPAMRATYEFVARAASSDSTVLIEGETGTGKELVAQAIHRNGLRRNGPFVAVNCAAITDTLFESELFGHERGAFTGANQAKPGLFEQARGGTMFMDEIGEMPLALQAKMLRALQERQIRRLGGVREVPVNVRVIAATNRSLSALMEAGKFREDLFYRLSVLTLSLPSLRQRAEDIPALAAHFIRKHAGNRRCIPEISPEARTALLSYGWPGNVRELENIVERACVFGDGPVIELTDLPDYITEVVSPRVESGVYRQAMTKSKRDLVLRTLEECNGNQSEAARKLGVHRNHVARLLQSSKPQDG